ncbi:MAG: DNA polymerase III subunit psi [Colwellia sp.]|nr:DNA polymerase III subunit psi [Colwellia sp.]
MTISKRQFDLLNVMNIPLWVAKSSSNALVEKKVEVVEVLEVTEEKSLDNKLKNNEHSIASITPLLAENCLFNDIILTLGLSKAEVNIEPYAVNLGLISWQFSSVNVLGFSNSQLTTPAIEQLEKSPALKRQLWQLLIESELVCH